MRVNFVFRNNLEKVGVNRDTTSIAKIFDSANAHWKQQGIWSVLVSAPKLSSSAAAWHPQPYALRRNMQRSSLGFIHAVAIKLACILRHGLQTSKKIYKHRLTLRAR